MSEAVPSGGAGAKLVSHRLRAFRGFRQWWAIALIGISTLLAYRPSLSAGFIWDDDDHVTQNSALESVAGLKRIWLERGAVPQYYPIVHTSFWVEHQLWDENPAGYHITNVVLHAIAALLLWRILLRLQVSGALLIALIFALHPVAVESVAWITERKNVLSAVFYLASGLAWLNTDSLLATTSEEEAHAPGSKSTQRWWYATSLLLFVAALLSKTVACSLPAAMLLVVWWKKGRVAWADVRPVLPFFMVGIVLALNTVLMERTRVGAVGAEWSFSIAERLLIAGRAIWFYVAKLLWPANLAFIYPRWSIDATAFAQWLFPIGVVVALVCLWLARHRMGRGPMTAALFFGGTLLPALGFVNVYPMRFSFVADHFQYLAMIGPVALVGSALSRHRTTARAAFALPVLLGVLTWRQTHVYRDLETLWTDTITRNPSAWLAHNNLGTVLLDRGNLQGAVEHYRAATRLKEDYYEAYGNLAAALLRLGALDEARSSVDAALRASPKFTPALITRAAILSRSGEPREAVAVLQAVLRDQPDNAEALNILGSVLASVGDDMNAQKAFEAALRVNPGLVQAHVNLARVLLRTGRIEPASAQVDEALAQSPSDADALNVRGLIVAARGGSEAAISYFRDLAQRIPDDASVRFNLGTALSQAGRTNEAIAEFLAATQLNPRHAEAHNNLGVAYLITGQYEQAAAQFEQAIALRRNNPEAQNNLGYALIRLGRTQEAVVHLRIALQLNPDYAEAKAQLRALGQRP